MIAPDLLPVSIVVPTFRRPQILAESLEALLRVDYPHEAMEIIVIDDGSEPATREVVCALQGRGVRIFYEAQPHQGVATARNRGARAAQGQVLIFVDDDIVVPTSFVRQHLEALSRFRDCLVNGHWEFAPGLAAELQATPFGRYRMKLEEWVKSGIRKTRLSDRYLEPEGVTACNLGVLREHFWRIGGFDEQFPYAGCEDQEFSIRAAAAGCRFVYDCDLRVWHNDQRLTLRQFCERQYRGAITAALLALKNPARCADKPLILENSPINRNDSWRAAFKKATKQLLSTRPARSLLHTCVHLLERVAPQSRLLPRLYWSMCGLYIARGVRDGLSRYAACGDKQ